MVCAIDIFGGRHGGGRDAGAEMRKVVGGPGSERKWMHGREGHATNTRGPGGRHNDDGASLSAVRCEKRPCMFSRPGLRREPVDLSVQTGATEAVYTHRRDGSTARGQTRQPSPWELLGPGHSTTAIPGNPSLLHTQLAEEAWGWSESSRHPGKSQVAHNLQVGVPGGAGPLRPGGGGWRLRAAQSGMRTTPHGWEINRRRDGTPVRPMGGMIGSIGGAPAGARSFASDRGRRRLRQKKGFSGKMGGHLRGYLTRAGGKEDERTIDESIDGGCTLSHETVVMNPTGAPGAKIETRRKWAAALC